MSPPRALLLDVLDTLVRDPFHDALPAFFGLDLPGFLAAKAPDVWPAFERGDLDEPAYLARMFRDGRAVDGAALRAALRGAYALLPGVAPLLDDLRAAGAPLYALSNYPPWWTLIEEALGLSRWLDWRFVSCRTGRRKPEPAAYLGAAAALGLPPTACLLVDDRQGNVDAALAVGMPALRFREAAALRRDLVAAGVLAPGGAGVSGPGPAPGAAPRPGS